MSSDKLNVALIGTQHAGKSHLLHAFFKWQNPSCGFAPTEEGKDSDAGTLTLQRTPIIPDKFELFDTRGYNYSKNVGRSKAVFAGLKNGTNLDTEWNDPTKANPGNACQHAIIVADATEAQKRSLVPRSSWVFWTRNEVSYSINVETLQAIATLYDMCRSHFGYPPIVIFTLREEVKITADQLIEKSGLALHKSNVYVINNTVKRDGPLDEAMARELKNIYEKMQFDVARSKLD